jgi:hypothetical protein
MIVSYRQATIPLLNVTNIMKKLIFIAIIILTFVIRAKACTCKEYNDSTIHSMIEHSDIIFIGKVIESDNWNPFTVEKCNKERRGSDVIIKVDSVIKGNIRKNELLFIYQSAGSCTENFRYESTHLIFGNQIIKIHKVRKELKQANEAPPSQYPSEYGLQEGGVYKTNADGEPLNFLRKQVKKYTVIDTDMCRSFFRNSDLCNKVLSYIYN